MRTLALFFFLLLAGFGSTSLAAELHIEVPEMVFSDVNSPVQVTVVSGAIPDYLIQVHDNEVVGDTLFLDTNQATQEIEVQFFAGTDLSFHSHSISNSTKTAVIPLWMSILPPLFAIFLALVFKDVIFSLVSGIFIGAAIIGFYAHGFVGIFTGFFRIIDTYVLNALNDSSHLSVIVFSIIIGGIVALISKNGGMQGIVNRVSRVANNARN